MYGGWLQGYETGMFSRNDGAITVTLPESAEALPLSQYTPQFVRETSQLDVHPAPQRVSRLRNWLEHEKPPPKTPEPKYAQSKAQQQRLQMAQMNAAVRGHEHSMRHAPGSSSPTKPRRRPPRGEERSGQRSLDPLPAPRARRQPRRTRIGAQQSRDEREDQKWKLHAGQDPMMSTQDILRLDALEDAEEKLVQSVMDLQAGEETFCTWLLNRPLIETILSVGNPLVLQKGLDELVEATVFEAEQKHGGQLQVRSTFRAPRHPTRCC